jgi:hypothetical protein
VQVGKFGMEEETEINNNDLNNNTDFEEEAMAADHLADMADMNPNDIMANVQTTLLNEAKLIGERIGYRVAIEQIYHFLEVAIDQENRVQVSYKNNWNIPFKNLLLVACCGRSANQDQQRRIP